MHGAIRAAGYSLMSMFVSCGVGAQDVSVSHKTGFTASPEEARAIAKEAYLYGYARDIREVMRGDGENPYFRWFVGE